MEMVILTEIVVIARMGVLLLLMDDDTTSGRQWMDTISMSTETDHHLCDDDL